MEKSKLESLPDKQLIQYIKYVLKTIGGYKYKSLVNFYEIQEDNYKLFSRIAAPIGKDMSRLDFEYIYWILNNNDPNELDTIKRPTLTTKEVTYVIEFKVSRVVQKSTDLPTYTSDEINSRYLSELVVNDEIDTDDFEVWERLADEDFDYDFVRDHFIVK